MLFNVSPSSILLFLNPSKPITLDSGGEPMSYNYKIDALGTRGRFFSFYKEDISDSFNIFVIVGEKSLFICDTSVGPEAMKVVESHLRSTNDWENKQVVVFYTHYDWDHIWGTCHFDNPEVIAHSLTKELIEEEGETSLENYASYRWGDVELRMPSRTFETELDFAEEKVRFFFTPGHTKDSSSCLDYEDNILVVGDNLENPKPYVRGSPESLLETYKTYHKINPSFFVLGHGEIRSDTKLLTQNREYVQSLIS